MDGITAERAILCAVLESRAENQDPIDLAVLSGVEAGQQLNRYRVTHPTLRPGAQAYRGHPQDC